MSKNNHSCTFVNFHLRRYQSLYHIRQIYWGHFVPSVVCWLSHWPYPSSATFLLLFKRPYQKNVIIPVLLLIFRSVTEISVPQPYSANLLGHFVPSVVCWSLRCPYPSSVTILPLSTRMRGAERPYQKKRPRWSE